MLTREAFNALLKTLEEPPEHVVFILATTDAHKLPETIVSRTQRFTFKPVEKAKVVEHLSAIAKNEGVEVSPEALELLAEHGEGSFRDSISLLDQAANQGTKLEAADVQRLLGMPSDSSLEQLLSLISESAPTSSVMQTLTDLYQQGFQAAAIAKQLGQSLRNKLAHGQLDMQQDKALDLMSQLIEVPIAHNPERYLEIVLLKYASTDAPTSPKKTPQKAEKETPALTETPAAKAVPKPKKQTGTAALDSSIWPDVLNTLKTRHNTLYGVVRMAQPEFGDSSINLAFAFAFHQKRLNEPANRQKIADIILELTGQKINIDCSLDKKAAPPTVETPIVQDKGDDLSAISNIFGGAELLES